MGRMTRAKATEIAEQMHIDEDAVLDLSSHAQETATLSTPKAEARPPLSDIAPNSGRSKQSTEADVERVKPATAKKGGKKGAKANKKNNTNPFGDSTTAAAEDPLEVIPDEIESVPSPASRAASDDLMKDEPERKCLCISTYPPRGHMTLMQGCPVQWRFLICQYTISDRTRHLRVPSA